MSSWSLWFSMSCHITKKWKWKIRWGTWESHNRISLLNRMKCDVYGENKKLRNFQIIFQLWNARHFTFNESGRGEKFNLKKAWRNFLMKFVSNWLVSHANAPKKFPFALFCFSCFLNFLSLIYGFQAIILWVMAKRSRVISEKHFHQ